MPEEWRVVRCREKHIREVANDFTNAGVRTYSPQIRVLRRYSRLRRPRRVSLPAYPGHLFISGGVTEIYRIIRESRYRITLMQSGGDDRVPQEQMDAVREMEEESWSRSMEIPDDGLMIGDTVCFLSGYLDGWTGILNDVSSESAVVLVGVVPITVSRALIRTVN